MNSLFLRTKITWQVVSPFLLFLYALWVTYRYCLEHQLSLDSLSIFQETLPLFLFAGVPIATSLINKEFLSLPILLSLFITWALFATSNDFLSFLLSLCITLYIFGISGRHLYFLLFKQKIPWSFGVAAAGYLFYNIVLALCLIGLFSKLSILICLLPFFLHGFALCLKQINYLKSIKLETSLCDSLLFYVAILCLLFAAIGSYFPDLGFDSQRYYMPFMQKIVETGQLTANHYSFMELAYWPIQNLGAVGYLFAGEYGGQMVSGWIFYFLTAILIYEVLRDQNASHRYSSFGAVCFLCNPIFFYYAQNGYVDMAYSYSTLIVIFSSIKALQGASKYIPLSMLTSSLAILIKPFAVFYIFSFFIYALLFKRMQLWQVLIIHKTKFLWGLGVGALLATPRILTSFIWTKNPFFPLLAGLFDDRFDGLSQTFLPGKDFYYFPVNFIADLFRVHEILVLHTSHKISDGALEHLAPTYAIIAMLTFTLITLASKKLLRQAPWSFMFLSISGMTIISIAHAPYLRYWYPSICLFLVFGFAWLDIFSRTSRGRILSPILLTLILFSFISTITVVMNSNTESYQWRPLSFIQGRYSKDDVRKTFGGSVVDFLNTNSDASSSIAVTGFYSNNLLVADVFDISPWWDAYNKMKTYPEMSQFIRTQHIKYWLMTKKHTSWHGFYRQKVPPGFFDKRNWVYEDKDYFVVAMAKLEWPR